MNIDRAITIKVQVSTPVPDDVPDVVVGYAGGRQFRVTSVREQIDCGQYTAWLWGPIQTKVGKDHSTHTGYRSLANSDVPAELAHLVLGEAELRRLLREAGEGR